MYVVLFFTLLLTDQASTIPSTIRGCQSGTWSAGQENIRGTPTKLHREHENKTRTRQNKNKTNQQKERNNNTKHMPEKKMGEEHSVERVWYSASREPSDNLPGSQQNYAPKRIASTTPYSKGLRHFYRHSRRRLASSWVGPINAALKRLKLATVTPGATSTLSASSVYLFLCRCSDAFSSPFTHAAINLQPPSCTVLYQAPGSSAAAVFQSP